MESETPKPSNTSVTPEATTAPNLQFDSKWQQTGQQISEFLAQLPNYLTQLFTQYRQPLINLALIIAAFITLRITLAVVDAINNIPLVADTFKLVGLTYSAWFIYRYLLKESTRQELSQKVQEFINK